MMVNLYANYFSILTNSYLIGASYGYFKDFHISTYGEAILLAIQSECKICIKGPGYKARNADSISSIIAMYIPGLAGCTIIFLVLYYGKLWNTENAAFALL